MHVTINELITTISKTPSLIYLANRANALQTGPGCVGRPAPSALA